jgi:hypothetical protein
VDSRLRGKDGKGPHVWIPACAGMTEKGHMHGFPPARE